MKSVYVWAGRQQWIETCRAILLIDCLEEFTLRLTGNWFGEAIEKVPIFLDPLRSLRLRDWPRRKWKLYLPSQSYYRVKIVELNELLRGEMSCEVYVDGI